MDGNATASFSFGPFKLTPTERLLLRDGGPVPLTPKTFDLLAVLVANAPRLLRKDELLRAVWPNTIVEEANLPYHVYAIRKALGEAPDRERYVETVAKQGYRFIAPVAVHDAVRLPSALARPDVVRFNDPVLPGFGRSGGFFQISPDGHQLAFAAEADAGELCFWLRTLGALQPVPWLGTRLSPFTPPMFWSPDGRSIAFEASGFLKRIDLVGGPARPICELRATAVGGTWNTDDIILFGNSSGALMRCTASGGTAVAVTDPSRGEMDIAPSFLSDGRRFLFLRVSRNNPERSGIYAADLDAAFEPKRIVVTGLTIFNGTFIPPTPTSRCAIVFIHGGDVYAQRFDETNLERRGEPVRIAGGVGSFLDVGYVSASARTLVHRAPEPDLQICWFSRQGVELSRIGNPAQFTGLALSPNGTRALAAKRVSAHDIDRDLWLFDTTRNAPPRRLTFESSLESWPVWVNDDTFMFGCSGGEGGIYEQAIDGARKKIVDTASSAFTTSATSDRELLLYSIFSDSIARFEVWAAIGRGESLRRQPLLRSAFDQSQAVVSPDQHWIAYVSNENGPNDVFIATLRRDAISGAVFVGRSTPVSSEGGFAPRWRGDSRELYYLTSNGDVMAAAIDASPERDRTTPVRLFSLPGIIPEWGVTQDGQRFLFAVPLAPQPPFQFVLNWQSLLGD